MQRTECGRDTACTMSSGEAKAEGQVAVWGEHDVAAWEIEVAEGESST